MTSKTSGVVDTLPKRIGSIRASFFDNGIIELTIEGPGKELQTAFQNSMVRIAIETGISAITKDSQSKNQAFGEVA